MKKPLSLLLMLAGAFFVWQWVLGRRPAATYFDGKTNEDAQRRAKIANNATMAETPPLAIVDWVKVAWNQYNAAVTTPQVLPDGTVIRGAVKIDPDALKTNNRTLNPLLFGGWNN